MVNEKRLIDAYDFYKKFANDIPTIAIGEQRYVATWRISDLIADAPTVNATVLPCKIGDYAYAIRNYKGHIHPQRGIVSEMYFLPNRNGGMKLCVAVKGIARGEWGNEIFATDAAAYAEIERRNNGKA